MHCSPLQKWIIGCCSFDFHAGICQCCLPRTEENQANESSVHDPGNELRFNTKRTYVGRAGQLNSLACCYRRTRCNPLHAPRNHFATRSPHYHILEQLCHDLEWMHLYCSAEIALAPRVPLICCGERYGPWPGQSSLSSSENKLALLDHVLLAFGRLVTCHGTMVRWSLQRSGSRPALATHSLHSAMEQCRGRQRKKYFLIKQEIKSDSLGG